MGFQDLAYYAEKKTGLVYTGGHLPRLSPSLSRRAKAKAGYIYIGTFQCNQNRPYINDKRQVCRRLYGKEVVYATLEACEREALQ